MSQKIDSDALSIVARAIGLTGAGGSRITELSDAILDQVLDVSDLIRRARTRAAFEGIYTADMENVHAGVGTLASSYNLFRPTVFRNPWPAPIPVDLDVWLLGACLEQTSGSGTVTATLSYDYDPARLAFSINNSGTAGTPTANPHPLARWDAVETVLQTIGLQENGEPWKKIGIRIPRQISATGGNLTFVSIASAAATFMCQLQIGLFPVGMGQDALV